MGLKFLKCYSGSNKNNISTRVNIDAKTNKVGFYDGVSYTMTNGRAVSVEDDATGRVQFQTSSSAILGGSNGWSGYLRIKMKCKLQY
jgi:hypothetical protein